MTTDRQFMLRAIELARSCKAEERLRGIPPKVGAVVTINEAAVAEAYRGDPAGGPGDHAEFVALEKKLAGRELKGAVVFTTLEPCTGGRSKGKSPCVQRLIKRGVSRVCVGTLDPNPEILGRGVRALVEAGIDVQLFDPDLQREIGVLNREFVDQFRAPGEPSTRRQLNVGGVAWKLERLIGASWAGHDPTTARVSVLQMIGENRAAAAVRRVTGKLVTRTATILGQLNHDGHLQPPDTVEEVPPSATVIVVLPLVPDYVTSGIPLLDLPRLAPLKITMQVDESTETLQFTAADTAELIGAFIRGNEPKEALQHQRKGR